MRRTLLALLALLLLPAPAGAVVGGRDASQDYPFMAQVRLDGGFRCGGSLVAADKVLTAGHCATDGEEGRTPIDAKRLTVVLGTKSSSGSGGESFKVTASEPHERWLAGEPYDVSILTLERASSRTPIAVAGDAQRATWSAGRSTRVLGWGNNASLLVVGLQTTEELQEVDVPIVDDGECNAAVGINAATEVCAGEPQGGKDSCQGDSGGPLLGSANGTLVQVGVVSRGFGCGLPSQYGVYARVADRTLRDWVAARLPAPPAVAPAPGTAPQPVAPPARKPAAKKKPAKKKKVSCKTRKQKRTKACKRIAAKRKAAARKRESRK